MTNIYVSFNNISIGSAGTVPGGDNDANGAAGGTGYSRLCPNLVG